VSPKLPGGRKFRKPAFPHRRMRLQDARQDLHLPIAGKMCRPPSWAANGCTPSRGSPGPPRNANRRPAVNGRARRTLAASKHRRFERPPLRCVGRVSDRRALASRQRRDSAVQISPSRLDFCDVEGTDYCRHA